jgi:hypothetical protein
MTVSDALAEQSRAALVREASATPIRRRRRPTRAPSPDYSDDGEYADIDDLAESSASEVGDSIYDD